MPDYSSNVMMESEEGLIHLSALKKRSQVKKMWKSKQHTGYKKKCPRSALSENKICNGIIFKKSKKQIKISSILALLAASSDSTLCVYVPNLYPYRQLGMQSF